MGTPGEEGITGLTDVRFLTVDGLQLHAWYTPPRDMGKPTILFLHGNSSNIKGFYPKAKIYIERGYGAFLCEYRGYGGNPGEPTEQGLYNDAEACLFALRDKGYGSWNLVYFGQSLGTGAAVDLAVKHPPKALVLESPYSSATAVAKLSYPLYPIDWMLQDKFDSISKIDKVKSRLFLVHGEADSLIPVREAARLFDKANSPKQFYSIAGGGHNDLYRRKVDGIIADWLENRQLNLYAPTKSYAGKPELKGMNEISVTTEDSLKLYAWFAQPKEKNGKIIVYFHGNKGNLGNLRALAQPWIDRGYGVYLCEYRGYGGNPGNPSEEGIYRDARAGIAWLKQQGYDPKQFVYYGFSMGVNVAIQAAIETAPALMVLESGASSALDVIGWQRPTLSMDTLRKFVAERFENLEKIPKIHVPVLFMHGEKDDLIPVHLARKLYDVANAPKYFKAFPEAGHRDTAQYGAATYAIEWIEENSGKNENAKAE
ncbi:MAG: alpha/beta hydrolase [Alphaproteobacteria bacterium]